MQKNKLSLGAFVKAVSQAVTEANQKLVSDFDKQALGAVQTGGYAAEPLCISRMRVSFSAHVNRSDRILQDNGTAELLLDFDRNSTNFQGEMEFLPFDQASEPGWEGEDPEPSRDQEDSGAGDGNDINKVAIKPLGMTGGTEYGNR